MGGCIVLCFADIDEGVVIAFQICGSVLDGDVLHLDVRFRSNDLSGSGVSSSFAGLYIVRISLGPGSEATLQSVDLGHIITQCRQNVGGCLRIGLAAVADQHQIVVDAAVQHFLHGRYAGIKIAVFGSVHVGGDSARNVGSSVILRFADIDEGVVIAFQICRSVLNGDVLHLNVRFRSDDFAGSFLVGGSLFLSRCFFLGGFRSFGGLLGGVGRSFGRIFVAAAASHHADQHGSAQGNCKNSFHDRTSMYSDQCIF